MKHVWRRTWDWLQLTRSKLLTALSLPSWRKVDPSNLTFQKSFSPRIQGGHCTGEHAIFNGQRCRWHHAIFAPADNYDVVKAKFDAHFVKKKNVIYEREKFNFQGDDKTVDSIMMSLFQLTDIKVSTIRYKRQIRCLRWPSGELLYWANCPPAAAFAQGQQARARRASSRRYSDTV